MRRYAVMLAVALATCAALTAAAPAGAAITCHQTASPTGTISTVQGLVNALAAGQTGCIRAGTYVGDVALNKSVTITSYGGENAVVRGRIVVTGAGARIEKLMLDGRNAGNLPSPTIHAADVVLRDNDITNVSTSAICVQTVTSGALVPNNFLIERNRIHHCGSLPYTNQLHGLYLNNGTGGIVRNNVVYDNADKGILVYPNLQGATIANNTIDGNGTAVSFGETSANNVVENNIVSYSTRWHNVMAYALTGAGNQVRSNCAWNANADPYYNYRGGIEQGIENYLTLGTNPVATPAYANRAAKDFSIAAGGGCAAYGAPATVAGLVPDTTMESGPSGAISSSSATYEFSSTRPGASFECRVDQGATLGTWGACTSPLTVSGSLGVTTTLNVRAKVGTATDASPAVRSFTPSAPDTTITAGPSGLTSSASPSWSFTASPSAGATFECSMDSTTAYAACTSPKAYTGLAEGAHTFRVRARNGAGTDATPDVRSITVDTVAPNTTITSPLPSGTASPSFTFTSSESGSTFECSMDGAAYASCTSPKAYSNLAAGSHTFRVRARDAAGNVDATPAEQAFTSPGTGVTCHQTATPTGTINTPTELINALTAGQTGCFRGGEYWMETEGNATAYNTNVAKSNITLRSYPGELATIHGRWWITNTASNVRLEKLKLDVYSTHTSGVGLVITGDDAVIKDNDITSNDQLMICVHPAGNSGSIADRFRIERNRIHDCGGTPNNHRHGVYVAAGNGEILHNVIYDNADRGIQLYPNADGVDVHHNTIDANGTGLIFGGCGPVDGCATAVASDNNDVFENVFTHANLRWNIEQYGPAGTGNTVNGNCVFASNAGYTTNGGIMPSMAGVTVGTNPIADPQYVNRAAKDFRVQNAACSGKGAPADVANPVGFPAS
ncbi:MAG: right-handed parallel beta-helix repeat-containing protein [Actinomycetota bacterium]|nr:right-handed parallel beta-helix repeat-containing protein [Actinomycetota bacterium]